MSSSALFLSLVVLFVLVSASDYNTCVNCAPAQYCDDGTAFGHCGACVGYGTTYSSPSGCPADYNYTGLSTAIITVIIVCSIIACILFIFLPIACCLGWVSCFAASASRSQPMYQQSGQIAVVQQMPGQPMMMQQPAQQGGDQPRVVTCGACNNQLLIAPNTMVGSMVQCTHCNAQFAVPANAPVYNPAQPIKTI